MNSRINMSSFFSSLVLSFACLPLLASAQEAAFTPAPATEAGLTTDAGRPVARRVGEATRSAMALQAEGVQAGVFLPMLGVAAAPAFKRHADSFSYPLPQWFQQTVDVATN